MVEEKMTNCPRCHKPILNGGTFTSPAKFTIRCPWCQSTLQIHIQPRIITEVIKLENGDTFKSGVPMETPSVTEPSLPMHQQVGELGLAAEQQAPSTAEKSQRFKMVGYMYPTDEKISS